MNRRQTRIIHILQWILYPLAVLICVGLVLDAGARAPGETGAGAGALSTIGDPLLLVALVVCGIGFIALLLEFLKREIAGGHQRSQLGEVILELPGPAHVSRFIPPVVALCVAAGLNIIAFSPDHLGVDPSTAGFAEIATFWFFYAVSHFLLLAFTLRAFRNRPFFVLTRRGFLYEPGDVSPGLILWEDVSGIEETQLLSASGPFAGPGARTVLAVTLRNADTYMRAYNPLLRAVNALATRVNKHQTGGPGDIVLAAEDFSGRYEEVKRLLRQHMQKS